MLKSKIVKVGVLTAVSFGAFLFSTDEVSAETTVNVEQVTPQYSRYWRDEINSWANSLFIIREINGFYYEGWVSPVIRDGIYVVHESGYEYEGYLTRQTGGGPTPTSEEVIKVK